MSSTRGPRTVDTLHPECRVAPADMSRLPPYGPLSNTNLCRLKHRQASSSTTLNSFPVPFPASRRPTLRPARPRAYQVRISGDITSCSCPAGINDKYCKHVAAAEMYREAHQLEQATSMAVTVGLHDALERSLEHKLADLY